MVIVNKEKVLSKYLGTGTASKEEINWKIVTGKTMNLKEKIIIHIFSFHTKTIMND